MSNTDELKHIHFSLLGSTAGKNDLYLKNLEPEHEIAPPWKLRRKIISTTRRYFIVSPCKAQDNSGTVVSR